MNARQETKWDVVKVFDKGEAIVEVSKSDGHVRWSFRLTWINGDRKGPWFPVRDASHLDDIYHCVAEAEKWVSEQRSEAMERQVNELKEKKDREAEKRKRHTENVEKRREENRSMAGANVQGKKK